ncbi:unnamed protein product [Spirodela intermedia]|uniref:Uncharacterized protein n=1 Tax=Spirodela intermedia TaxID=51605 RepID=A0A7I8K1Y6_SPIIN|nr:unnamed protein product [Spirodela intermedia]
MEPSPLSSFPGSGEAPQWSQLLQKKAPRETDEPVSGRLFGNWRSSEGVSLAVLDASAIVQGDKMSSTADRFVTVREVLEEVRDPTSRQRLSFLPFTIETMEPAPDAIKKVVKFARETGDLQTLSDVDIKLIALTYMLEAQIHGTGHLKSVPPPIQMVNRKSLPESEMSGWGSNVPNLAEWEALEPAESESNSGSSILSLKDLNLNLYFAIPLNSSVACVTGDFAMQNVVLEMGLRLLAPSGLQIRQLHRWVLKCHACNKVTSEVGRLFCPKCGNGGTLRKVSVAMGENGLVLASGRPHVNLRGTKFSIPLPQGGRDGISKNLVLREDQVPRKLLYPKGKKKSNKQGIIHLSSSSLFAIFFLSFSQFRLLLSEDASFTPDDKDGFGAEDIFSHGSERKAPLKPPVGKAVLVFTGKTNPNNNHFSRRH